MKPYSKESVMPFLIPLLFGFGQMHTRRKLKKFPVVNLQNEPSRRTSKERKRKKEARKKTIKRRKKRGW